MAKTTSASVRTFFASSSFAVVGANSNPERNGYRVFMWYRHHSLPVTPINSNVESIVVPRLVPFITTTTSSSPTTSTSDTSDTLSQVPSSTEQTIPVLHSVTALPDPSDTSISIVTPPAVTARVLREARDAGVAAVWLQPGTFDDEVLRFAREEGRFRAVVAGDDDEGQLSLGDEGWCVLMDGETGLGSAGKL